MNPFLHLFNENKETFVAGLTDEMKCLYIYKKFLSENSILFVTNSLYEANHFYQILANYTDHILLFPMDDFLTSEALAISPDLKYKRLETLNTLLVDSHQIVITNLMGYLRFLPILEVYQKHQIILKQGKDYNYQQLVKDLFLLGYSKESIVNKTGEIALRGFVLDVFPVNEDYPIRISFWGDTIDTIKTFDITSQLTKQKLEQIIITSNTEFIVDQEIPFEEMKQKNLKKFTNVSNITGYLENPLTIMNEFHDIKVGYQLLKEEMIEYSLGEKLDADTQYMNNLEDLLDESIIYLSFLDHTNSFDNIFNYNGRELEPFDQNPLMINKRLNSYLRKNKIVCICVENRYSANKIIEQLNNDHIIFTDLNHIEENKINLFILKMSYGFVLENYVIITEREIFNRKSSKVLYKTKFKLGSKIRDINKLNVGDYVVHGIHGIGRYAGIKTLLKNGLKKDYLMIEYAGSDKLYIPVEKIEFIHKYSSNENLIPKLNKLGTSDWQKTKIKVKKKIENIASELFDLYTKREQTKGYAFLEDTKEQYQFESEFPYTPTDDQLKVMAEIKSDMEKEKPMNRLVCGDVGFGKTELAFRAMFKAVMSGKQVAMLCPTTILSNQHYQNALDRFEHFGVEVALLNRFITGNKMHEILNRLKEGKIDIIIGTHKLLGKDIVFKNLGLLVIDEEQRFGVKHKEKFKQYRHNIDVLTLSATPIPRTLQMSMSGFRSLSLLQTPPAQRYPVQTYVLAENDQIIKDALYKELSRGGQAFVLYNHVDQLKSEVRRIQSLVKDARIIYAHGQMSKHELENVMESFMSHQYDILVCTTIIETGIDIANVNTLLIMDADRFGLSQLYQIRGRVGRTNKIAYCYLMYDKRKILSEVALKRLKVIKEFTELGSGFAIAVRDLSIRGAGDILGSEQAGFIDSVGVEMFLNMLNEEMERLKGNEVVAEPQDEKPLLEVETSIDNQYVSDESLKIEIHKKINEIDSREILNDIKRELEDRFGKINEQMLVYMYEKWFEKLAKKLHINNIKQTKNSVELILPKEITDHLDGQKLFVETSTLTRMFRFAMRGNKLIIILDIVKLDKHFIYYLIELLDIINSCLTK